MSRQLRRAVDHTDSPGHTETVFGHVMRANLNGRLYLHPHSPYKRSALRELHRAGLVERVPRSAASLGGWFARVPWGTLL
jgi:hypothetical protein